MKTFFHSCKNTITYNKFSLSKIENIGSKKLQIINSFKFTDIESINLNKEQKSNNTKFSKLYNILSDKKLGAPNLKNFIDFDKFKHSNVNSVNPVWSDRTYIQERETNKKIRELKSSLNLSKTEIVDKFEKLEFYKESEQKIKDQKIIKKQIKEKITKKEQLTEEEQKIHNENFLIQSTTLDPMDKKLLDDKYFYKLGIRTRKNLSQKEETKDLSEKIDNGNYSPCSPRLGPFEVKIAPDLKIEEKNFHWCSCGLSKKQPFCDRSHKGTVFKPVNFQLAERKEKIYLCGCKLSKEAPFCDFKTCIKLAQHEELIVNKKLEMINEKIDKKL
jgi:CDGSH-type Zn-finger protein